MKLGPSPLTVIWGRTVTSVIAILAFDVLEVGLGFAFVPAGVRPSRLGEGEDVSMIACI